jgi:hypothetical protein
MARTHDVREFIAKLAKHGWVFRRYCGSGHIMLGHGTMQLTLAATPSNHRWRRNAEAQARRLERGALTERKVTLAVLTATDETE